MMDQKEFNKKTTKELQIVELGTQKFLVKNEFIDVPSGYALFHPKFGYFSLGSDWPLFSSKENIEALLKDIKKIGGFNFSEGKWVHTIN